MSASSDYDTSRWAESNKPAAEPPFIASSRNVIDINDSNNAQYQGGQITFDLNALTSNEDYLDWGSSYVTIPVLFSVTAVDAIFTGNPSDVFFMALKGSNFSIINSINVNCSNQNVISNQLLSNIPIEYKFLTSFNSNDTDVLSKSIGFWKNSSTSFMFDTAIGEVNNWISPSYVYPYPTAGGHATSVPVIAPLTSSTSYYVGFNNVGFYRKCYSMAISSLDPAAVASYGNSTGVVNACKATQTNYQATAATGTSSSFTLWLQLPMRYMHDLFMKMPLCRGALWQMTISTHLAPCSVAVTQIISSTDLIPSTVTGIVATNTYGFTPFMVGPIVSGTNPTDVGVCGPGILKGAEAAEVITYTASINAGPCVMHCVTYKLSPKFALQYAAHPRKEIIYTDFIRYAPSGAQNQVPNATVNVNVTPGQSKVRGLLIVPTLAQPSTPATQLSALQSPYTSAGATVAPFSFCNNLNVMVGGKTIWQKPIIYTYDDFLREQFGINGPNGNDLDGLRTGLISEYDFMHGYGFQFINLERKIGESDSMPVSVDVTFLNGTAFPMSYNFFLFYEKRFIIDLTTGKMLV